MVEIGPVVSEEKIFEKVYRRTTDDGRQVMTIAHTGELKIIIIIIHIMFEAWAHFFLLSNDSVLDVRFNIV